MIHEPNRFISENVLMTVLQTLIVTVETFQVSVREILKYAGRIRQYAYQFCQNERKFEYTNSNISLNQEIILRYH